MANDPTYTTIVGNLTADPELRHTASSVAVVNFTIASTPRVLNRDTNEWSDGDTVFMKCEVWREMADNIAATFTKGMRVFASGTLKPNNWEKDGEKRTELRLAVDECGPSVRYATAVVTRIAKAGHQGGAQAQAAAPAAQAPAPAMAAASVSAGEPEF